MPTATFPFATCDPFFMEEEPFDRPGNDAIDDIFARAPVILDGIIDAKTREFRRMTETIDMLRWFARAPRVRTDGRIDNEDTDIRIIEMPAIEVTA